MKNLLKKLKESKKWQQFKKRTKSLIWRIADMAVVFAVAFMIEELTSLEVSGTYKVLVGLLIGELTKWLNSKDLIPKNLFENVEEEDLDYE